MLYLAEVQKKTRAFGGSKAEFKLLACQRAEHSWSAVGEEIIPAPDDVPYNSGALVLVDLSGSRSVQRYTDAGKQLVSILQNFSRLQEKFKTQEEEIEQWKQSLTYQSQELNRREMEMEARQEQMQGVEADLEKLEEERQSVDALREEVNQLQEDFNRKSQELEGAWAQLNGEKRRFEEQQGDVAAQQTAGLDEEQAQRMKSLLDHLATKISTPLPLSDTLGQAQNLVQQKQEALDGYWQNLEQQKQDAQQLQDELEGDGAEPNWDAWHNIQEAFLKNQSVLEAQQEELQNKQTLLTSLSGRLEKHDALEKVLHQLADGNDPGDDKVDVSALEQMPLEQLQSIAQDLKRDLEKNARFVSSQEEELTLQQQDIDAIKQRIAEASEYDRLQLETELSDEQESYRMLNETLVGQRRNVQEREAVLHRHEAVLARRQGLPAPRGGGSSIDLSPALTHAEQLKGQLAAEIESLKQAIADLEQAIATQTDAVQQQQAEVKQQRDNLLQQEHSLKEKKVAAAELWGKVNTYQDVLHLTQETLNGLRDKLTELSHTAAQVQSSTEEQSQSISEIQNALSALVVDPSPQLAAS